MKVFVTIAASIAAFAPLTEARIGAPPELKGAWMWTWNSGSVIPDSSNIALSFSGWADVEKALDESQVFSGTDTYFTVGGGNSNGMFTVGNIQKVVDGLETVVKAGYVGIAFDIEECEGSIEPTVFEDAFKAARSHGLKVLVTVSHSAPYNCANGADLMNAFFESKNIDFISPQLYSSGDKLDFDENPQMTWTGFQSSTALVTPSVPAASDYAASVEFFQGKGVTLSGFIQWEQESGGSPGKSTRCGKSWADANIKCGVLCPSGTDAECPSGEKCFASLDETPCKSTRCGKSWADANIKCGVLCPSGTDAECPSGEKCFASLDGAPCKSTRCGKSWADANIKCGVFCPSGTDAECPSGEKCFASLDGTPCK